MIDIAHEAGFALHWAASEPQLRRALARRIPHASDRDDALQEAALSAWRGRASFVGERPFGAWAWGIVRRSGPRLRQAGVVPLHEHDAAATPDAEAEREHVRSCLAALPAEDRLLLTAAHVAAEPLVALAARRGIAFRTVVRRLRRAEARLRRALADGPSHTCASGTGMPAPKAGRRSDRSMPETACARSSSPASSAAR